MISNPPTSGGAGTAEELVAERAPAPVRVVVLGCAGHARVVLEILESDKNFQVVGLLDKFKPITTSVKGYQVIGSDEDLPALFAANICDGVFVAVGDNWVRGQIVKRIKALLPQAKFVTAIHRSAQISRNVSIGAGTVIMAGVVVNTGCKIGDFCTLNTASSLDHDSTLKDFSSLAPGAVTGGTVEIGAFSAVAIGAVVSHAVKIGEHTVIGAGATVLREIPDLVVAYGTPARVIRKRSPGDLYLGERSYSSMKTETQQSAAIVHLHPTPKMIPSRSVEWTDYIERTKHDFFHRAEYHRFTEAYQDGRGWLCVYGTWDKFIAWPIMIEPIESAEISPARALQDISSVYGYAGPVACGCENDREFLSAAWKEVTNLWRSQDIVSVFARFHPLIGNHRLLPYLRDDRTHLGFEHDLFAEGATVAIDLRRPPEDIWQSYDRRLRQALRRLSTAEMTATHDPDWQHLDDFVRLYHATMKRNNANPFYFFSTDYFRKLRQDLGSQGSLLVTKYGGTIASIALLIEYGSVVNVHFLASDDALANCRLPSLQFTKPRPGREAMAIASCTSAGDAAAEWMISCFVSVDVLDQAYPFYTGRWILDREADYRALRAKYQQLNEPPNGGTSGSFSPGLS